MIVVRKNRFGRLVISEKVAEELQPFIELLRDRENLIKVQESYRRQGIAIGDGLHINIVNAYLKQTNKDIRDYKV